MERKPEIAVSCEQNGENGKIFNYRMSAVSSVLRS